jgi:hypothetical protein
VQPRLPIAGDTPARSRHGLVQRMMRRRGERGPGHKLFASVVVEPIFARLEAGNDRVVAPSSVGGRVLARGVVAASDVAALGAASQMEPPASCGFAIATACTARLLRGVDCWIAHVTALLDT